MMRSPYPGDLPMVFWSCVMGAFTLVNLSHAVKIRKYGAGWPLNVKAFRPAFFVSAIPATIGACHYFRLIH